MELPFPWHIFLLHFLVVGAPEHDVRAFIQEIEMLKAIGVHENIIQLYATTSYNGRYLVSRERFNGYFNGACGCQRCAALFRGRH